MSERLLNLSRGNWRAAEYALDFRTLAAGSRCNKSVLKAAFRHRLKEENLTAVACCDENACLDSFIDLTIHLDNMLRKCPTP